MDYATVLALIQAEIIANGNNEITANVLRPVLEAMLNQPNDLVGALDDLDTSDTSSIVNAINSILSENAPNRTVLFPIDTTGVDFDQDELLWVRDAINNTASNNGAFTCNLGEQMVFYLDVYITDEVSANIIPLQRQYYRLTSGATSVSSLGSGNNPPLMPDGIKKLLVDTTSDLVIDLGDIGTDDIEDAFNSDASQPFTIDRDKFVMAVQDSENKLWQWIGGNGTFGNSATLATSTDFVDLTSGTNPPLSNPLIEELRGTTVYESITGDTDIDLDLTSFYSRYITTDDDLEINFLNTPAEGFAFKRRIELVIPTTKVLTIPSATILGDYVADGSTVNQIDLFFANYETEGLTTVAIINGGSSSSGTVTSVGSEETNASIQLKTDLFRTYGQDAARTGDIVIDDENCQIGYEARIIHEDSSEPEITTEFSVIKTGVYLEDERNDIYLKMTAENELSVFIVSGAELTEAYTLPTTFTLNNMVQDNDVFTSTTASIWLARAIADDMMVGDGFIEMELVDSDSYPTLLGFDPSLTAAFNFLDYGVFVSGANSINRIENGSATDLSVTPSSGDLIRLERSGTNVLIKHSTNGGSSYTTLHTYTSVSTADFYVAIFANGDGKTVSNVNMEL